MDRLSLLKPSRFGNAEKRRLLDSQKLKEQRSLRRTNKFNLQRDVTEENDNAIENVPPKSKKLVDRKLALQQFKAEKEAKKREIQRKKKPPFVVGIPRHGTSPMLRNSKFSFQPTVPFSEKKLTSPHTPTVLKRSVQKTRPARNVSNLAGKLQTKHAKAKQCDIEEDEEKSEEDLAVPLGVSIEDATGVEEDAFEEVDFRQLFKLPSNGQETKEIAENVSPTSPVIKTEPKTEVYVDEKDNELIKQVAFQHGRLQSETERLLGLAEQWQATILRETVPQEVADEVDCLVGQTRLLTGDKFQQFRRLVDQYEQKTGSHVITWDDLNGFWDMVYLQVESLDKRYAELDCLKNNNWVRAEPPRKKKRLPANKQVKKVTKPASTNEKVSSQPGDQLIRTPSSDARPLLTSVLMHRKRTRSNSPSPYIAMRLSGICKTPNVAVEPIQTDLTPKREILSPELRGTPKSALRDSWKQLTESTKKRRSLLLSPISPNKIKIDIEDVEKQPDFEEPLAPVTPRRSVRLMTKMSTPASCAACELNSCKKSECKGKRRSQRVSQTPKAIIFPVDELDSNNSEADSVSASQEKRKPTTRVRFSLRPSVLTVGESTNEVTSKVAKGRNTSVCFADSAETEHEQRQRRSTRQSKRVTFETVPDVEEKAFFKLPATPFRKSRADS